MNGRVLALYKQIMSQPEGLPHREYRRLVRDYVREMSPDDIGVLRSREEEIEADGIEEQMLRKEIFLELGFMDVEAGFFARCRLDSPGIRTLIRERVEFTQHAKPAEIKRINAGDRGTLRALRRLYKGVWEEGK